MALYDLYGLAVATEHDLENPVPLLTAPRPADLTFTVARRTGTPGPWDPAVVVDEQRSQQDGPIDFVFARFEDHDAVRIGAVMDFEVHDEAVVCHLYDDAHEFLVEIAFLGMVMALWFERRGRTTLHASVVTVHGSAVAFLGGKGSGKTSIMAACLQRGHPLLVDDLVVLTETVTGFGVERGYPSLRMWPAQAEQLAVAEEHLSLVRPDTTKVRADVREALGQDRFAPAGPVPLACLFLLERRDAEVSVRTARLTPADAVMTTIRNSFLPTEVHRFGWQPRRLAALARLTVAVPVVRLRYPSGYDRLADVVHRVQEHVLEQVRTTTDPSSRPG